MYQPWVWLEKQQGLALIQGQVCNCVAWLKKRPEQEELIYFHLTIIPATAQLLETLWGQYRCSILSVFFFMKFRMWFRDELPETEREEERSKLLDDWKLSVPANIHWHKLLDFINSRNKQKVGAGDTHLHIFWGVFTRSCFFFIPPLRR